MRENKEYKNLNSYKDFDENFFDFRGYFSNIEIANERMKKTKIEKSMNNQKIADSRRKIEKVKENGKNESKGELMRK